MSRGTCAYSMVGTLCGLGIVFSSQPQAAERAESGGFVLEEIQVTALRVQERLPDTPVSVAVLSPETLARWQILSTDELDWNGICDAGTPFLQLSYETERLTAVNGACYFRERSDDHLVVTFPPPGVAVSPPGFVPPSTVNCDCNPVQNDSRAAFTT